jgi:hypothetical protein
VIKEVEYIIGRIIIYIRRRRGEGEIGREGKK